LFNDVIVVTDSDEIYKEISDNGGKAMMSKGEHESGTDRIAEAARELKADVIMNVQGDTPFVKREPLQQLLAQFNDPQVQVGSLMQLLTDQELIDDPNYVKVCVDKNSNALFFSRSVIPYPRNKNISIPYYEHIGVYAFRKKALLDFTGWPVSPLEDAEKVECLRYLENGVAMRMVVTGFLGIEIDTPEDLEKAERLL
jgi:3-deoxy-manno-octulosonate cytidylyltransferase (CMP-KDO synthetase)